MFDLISVGNVLLVRLARSPCTQPLYLTMQPWLPINLDLLLSGYWGAILPDNMLRRRHTLDFIRCLTEISRQLRCRLSVPPTPLPSPFVAENDPKNSLMVFELLRPHADGLERQLYRTVSIELCGFYRSVLRVCSWLKTLILSACIIPARPAGSRVDGCLTAIFCSLFVAACRGSCTGRWVEIRMDTSWWCSNDILFLLLIIVLGDVDHLRAYVCPPGSLRKGCGNRIAVDTWLTG